MEAFEITYFCKRDGVRFTADALKAVYGAYMHLPNETAFDAFDEPEKDYYEVRCCIFGLRLDAGSFHLFAGNMRKMSHALFTEFPCIAVCTGIYELTYYYTERMLHLTEFSGGKAEKFPLIFLREPDASLREPFFSDESLTCYYHSNAQQLF